jgi:hypothetical protein
MTACSIIRPIELDAIRSGLKDHEPAYRNRRFPSTFPARSVFRRPPSDLLDRRPGFNARLQPNAAHHEATNTGMLADRTYALPFFSFFYRFSCLIAKNTI